MELIAIEYRQLSEIRPRAGNPRTHTEEQVAEIAASIEEFGWTNPILIDGDAEIIAGHGRQLAALLRGDERVPTITLRGLSESQRRAYVIADNKLALNAGWDTELLALDVEALAEAGFDLALTGFSEQELVPYTGRVGDAEFPELSDTDRVAFQRMAFVLHDDQVEVVKAAIAKARVLKTKSPNTNKNGNALAAICDWFIEHGTA